MAVGSHCVFPSFKHCGHTQRNGRFFVVHVSMYLQSWHEKSFPQATQPCMKLTMSSFKIPAMVSMSFSTLLKLIMQKVPCSRLYSNPSLNSRMNFSLSTRGSLKAFLFNTTTCSSSARTYSSWRESQPLQAPVEARKSPVQPSALPSNS